MVIHLISSQFLPNSGFLLLSKSIFVIFPSSDSSHRARLRLQFEGFGRRVVAGQGLVEVSHEIIDSQGVEILADEVENQPIADLLHVGQRLGLQDGFHIGTLRRFSALNVFGLRVKRELYIAKY